MGLTGGVGIDTLVTIILADVLIFAFSVSEEAIGITSERGYSSVGRAPPLQLGRCVCGLDA